MDGHVTVTMAAHPLVGRRMRVLRWVRTFHGARYVEIEFPPGHGLRLPAHWVDGETEPRGEARARLSAATLVRLSEFIGAKLDGLKDRSTFRCDGGDGEAQRCGGERHRAERIGSPRLVGARLRSAGESGGEPGIDAAPIDARRSRRRRGGSR